MVVRIPDKGLAPQAKRSFDHEHWYALVCVKTGMWICLSSWFPFKRRLQGNLQKQTNQYKQTRKPSKQASKPAHTNQHTHIITHTKQSKAKTHRHTQKHAHKAKQTHTQTHTHTREHTCFCSPSQGSEPFWSNSTHAISPGLPSASRAWTGLSRPATSSRTTQKLKQPASSWQASKQRFIKVSTQFNKKNTNNTKNK